MSSELPPTSNPGGDDNSRRELEARLTALILGELPAGEAAALKTAIEKDPQLSSNYNRILSAVQLVREAAAAPVPASEGAPLKLSADRREKLLAHFKTVAPKEFTKPRKRRTALSAKLVTLAASIVIVAMIAAFLMPPLQRARSASQSNTIENNLRQLDGAKQQWALEYKKGPDVRPTFQEIQPYLGRGLGELPKPVLGETYVLGKVSEPPVAELRKGGKLLVLMDDGSWKPAVHDGISSDLALHSPSSFLDKLLPIAKRERERQSAAPGEPKLLAEASKRQSEEQKPAAVPQAKPAESPKLALNYRIALPQADTTPPAATWSFGENSGSSHDGWAGDANKDSVRSWDSEPSKPALTSNDREPKTQDQGLAIYGGAPNNKIREDLLASVPVPPPDVALNFQTSPAAPAAATPTAGGKIVLPSTDQTGATATANRAFHVSGVGLIGEPEWAGILNRPAPSTSAANAFIARNDATAQQYGEVLADAAPALPPAVAPPPALASAEQAERKPGQSAGDYFLANGVMPRNAPLNQPAPSSSTASASIANNSVIQTPQAPVSPGSVDVTTGLPIAPPSAANGNQFAALNPPSVNDEYMRRRYGADGRATPAKPSETGEVLYWGIENGGGANKDNIRDWPESGGKQEASQGLIGGMLVPAEPPKVLVQRQSAASSTASSSSPGPSFGETGGGGLGGGRRAIDGDVLTVGRPVDQLAENGKRPETQAANAGDVPLLGDIPTTGHLFRKPEEVKREAPPPIDAPSFSFDGGKPVAAAPTNAQPEEHYTVNVVGYVNVPISNSVEVPSTPAIQALNGNPGVPVDPERQRLVVIDGNPVPVLAPPVGAADDGKKEDVLGGKDHSTRISGEASSIDQRLAETNPVPGNDRYAFYNLGISQPGAEKPPAQNEAKEPMFPAGEINFPAMDTKQVLDFYGVLTGRKVESASNLPGGVIRLKSTQPMTKSEAIKQLDAALAMNGIAMVDVGDKVVKALPGGEVVGRVDEANRRKLAEKDVAQVEELGRGEKGAVSDLAKKENRSAAATQTDVAEARTAELLADDLAKMTSTNHQTVEQGVELQMAKRDLERMEEFRDVLALRQQQEGLEKALPREQMATEVDKADVQPEQKPSLGQRIKQAFTGKVERFARVNVGRDTADLSGAQGPQVAYGTTLAYDPYFIATEKEVIQSEPVLDKAIEKLKLEEAWGEKDGKKLTMPETRALLKQRLDLRSESTNNVLDIGVKSSSPEEAAKIANAVAESYAEHRQEQRRQLTLHGLMDFENKLKEYDQKVSEAEQKVAELEKRSGGQATATTNSAAEEDRPLKRPAAPVGVPQPEVQTSDNAFSTFSMNVSDVSWKLAAASLEKGQMPEAATVRSEEFLNAFDYRDPEPPAGVPIGFAWERAQYPFAQNRDLLRFSVKTAAEGRQSGCPMNIVLLLDNSGSMERADRVRIIHEALRVLATKLQPQDKLSVVLFARTARLLVDGVPGDQAAQVAEEVGGLTPQGGTNLEEAMNLAYQTALRHYLARGVNRVVLLTDGAANLGNIDPEALQQKVEANRKQGVALDCFGIGWEGYNDDLLEVLSSHGDGRYAFLNTPEDAATDFAAKLAGALHVAAADCKVQVEFNPKRVTAYRQIGYAKFQLTKEQFRDNTVDAAEIGAAESGNSLYVIEVNPRGEGPLATVRVRYRVPGTSDYPEHEWEVPYTGSVPTMDHASPGMRLAGTAAAFSEWLVSSPYAAEVTPDRLLAMFSGVPEVYGADERPKKLEWMIRQANSLVGADSGTVEKLGARSGK